MTDILKELSKPFPANKISWRPGAMTKDKSKAIPLAYIDARDVMERLDEVCGLNWQDEYPFNGCCKIGVLTESGWIWRSNGAGATDIEGEKGEFSGAFKRAAVMFGIGRYLYDVPNVWMPINQYKKFEKETILQLTSKLDNWQTKYFEVK